MDGRGEYVIVDTGVVCESVILVCPVAVGIDAESVVSDNCAVADCYRFDLKAFAESICANLGVACDINRGDVCASECAGTDILNSRKIGSCGDSSIDEGIVTDVGELAEFDLGELLATCKCIVAELSYTGKLDRCQELVARECAVANCGYCRAELNLLCYGRAKKESFSVSRKEICSTALRFECGVAFCNNKGCNLCAAECIFADNGNVFANGYCGKILTVSAMSIAGNLEGSLYLRATASALANFSVEISKKATAAFLSMLSSTVG